jgi:hypothetical protein
MAIELYIIGHTVHYFAIIYILACRQKEKHIVTVSKFYIVDSLTIFVPYTLSLTY